MIHIITLYTKIFPPKKTIYHNKTNAFNFECITTNIQKGCLTIQSYPALFLYSGAYIFSFQ